MLEDVFGRQFQYLRLSVTDKCNFRCQYCLPNGYKKKAASPSFLSVHEIKNLVSTFAELGLRKVRITGGEPVLRPDLTEILHACKNTSHVRRLCVTTNGYRLLDWLPVFQEAGVDQLNVSVDSFDQQYFSRITGYRHLDRILTAIDHALSIDQLTLKINTVWMKDAKNNDLKPFLDYIRARPLTLRFIELMETGKNKTVFNRSHQSLIMTKSYLIDQGWRPIEVPKNAGPAEEFYHPDYLGKIGLIMPYSSNFCHQCNRLRVSALGKLHLCLFSEAGLDLRPWLQHRDQREELVSRIQTLLKQKALGHRLEEGLTGANQQFSLLGG